jgi:hypothetical protein
MLEGAYQKGQEQKEQVRQDIQQGRQEAERMKEDLASRTETSASSGQPTDSPTTVQVR